MIDEDRCLGSILQLQRHMATVASFIYQAVIETSIIDGSLSTLIL